jgi:VCBS repeat protein
MKVGERSSTGEYIHIPVQYEPLWRTGGRTIPRRARTYPRWLPRALNSRARVAAPLLLIALAAPAHTAPLFRAPSLILDTRDMPLSVAMEDFDGDSRQDLAVVVSGGVAVWRGNGDGTFRDRTDLDTGGVPRSVAVADLDQDGLPDLVTANPGSVAVLLGNGDGTFRPRTLFGAAGGAMAVADIDGDGDLDVVVSGSVLLNRGDGTFGAPAESTAQWPASAGTGDETLGVSTEPASQGPSSIAIGDLNLDGHPDLVAANHWANPDDGCPGTCAVSVHLGNGDGTFGAGAGFGTGYFCPAVAIADFNRDGRPDVVFSNNHDRETTVSILLGNGDGTLGGQRDFGADWSPYALAIADVNADGRWDIAVTNVGDGDYHPNSVSILLGDGYGNFSKSANLSVREVPNALAIGDLDADGRLDLAVTCAYEHSVAILLGNGNGTFGTPEYALRGWATELAIADMNRDGRPDVLTGDSGTYPTFGDAALSVLLGSGDGTLQAKRDFQTGSIPYDIQVSDLNGDDVPDAVVAKAITSTVSVHVGSGDGTLRPRTDLVTGGSPYSVAVDDLNGDGRKDLAVAKTASNTVAVMLGNGNGTFGGQSEFAVGGAPTTVAIRDFDRDDRPDLLTLNEATNSISVLRGRGDGTFEGRIDRGIRGSPLMTAIGDLDNDGRLDLVIRKNNGDSVSVLLGRGDGTFGVESGVRLWTSYVAIADFDADGRNDLAALHDDYHAGSISVLLGNGDGTFGSPAHYGVAKYPQTLEACDLNGDARMDLVVAGGESISLLLGNAGTPVPFKRYAIWRGQSIETPAPQHFALEGFRPNPALRAPAVAFTLADASPATIEVLDLAGRRVLLREVGGLGAGRHLVPLESSTRLAPGAYVMRLRQAGRTLSARGVVVR